MSRGISDAGAVASPSHAMGDGKRGSLDLTSQSESSATFTATATALDVGLATQITQYATIGSTS